jgi:cobalt-precorrin 5A hydrolase
MSAKIAIGIGCRLGCSAELIEGVVRQALERIPAADAPHLFSIADKRGEPGLAEAASRLGLQLGFLPREALAARGDEAKTRSSRVQTLFGVPSVAEAAALAGAGPGSTLIVARIANRGATCAIAQAAGPT